MRPGEREAIPDALAGITAEMTCAADLSDRDQEAFMGEIAAFVKLTGGGWPTEQRQEFIDQSAVELALYPVGLVVGAIAAARKKVWDPKRFVSWVVEQVEPEVVKLRAEAERLERLAEIARDA